MYDCDHVLCDCVRLRSCAMHVGVRIFMVTEILQLSTLVVAKSEGDFAKIFAATLAGGTNQNDSNQRQNDNRYGSVSYDINSARSGWASSAKFNCP